MDKMFLYGLIGFLGVILFLNVIKIFVNIFTTPKAKKVEEANPLRDEIRQEIDKELKPHLNSLEGMYEKSESEAGSFSAFVLSVFKDKFPKFREENEELLESEICQCCGEYEGAECKESFCLEGTGISCPNS